MTPAQRRALATLERLAGRFEPRLRVAYQSAIERVQQAANIAAAERALEQGDIDGAVAALLPPAATLELTRALTIVVATVMGDAAQDTAREIGATIRQPFTFVPTTTSAVSALERMQLRAIVPVAADAEAGLRTVLADGLRAGVNPRTVAREVRQFLTLTDHDARLLASFEADLTTDPRAALARQLRDKRFDGSLIKAINGDRMAGEALTEAQRSAMRAGYVRNLTRWRAETWARTTTLQAMREAQWAAWQQAIELQGLDRTQVYKVWITTLDGRERPTHHAQHGDVVPMDARYANGDMIPGDGTGVEGVEYNCRCTQQILILPANPQAAHDFLATTRRRYRSQRSQRSQNVAA